MGMQTIVVAHPDLVSEGETTLHSHVGGGGGMQTGFRFYGSRLQSWDLAGRQTIWVTGNQRLKADDITGEIKIE